MRTPCASKVHSLNSEPDAGSRFPLNPTMGSISLSEPTLMKVASWERNFCSRRDTLGREPITFLTLFFQSSGAIVTRKPSRASLNGSWHDRRDVALRWSELSSRSFSSSIMGGSLSSQSSSTWTWHVAQEQQPPHRASNSSTPASRMTSITEMSADPMIADSVPSRVVNISFGMMFHHS